MLAKVFHLRLTKEHLTKDQEDLNKFLETVKVESTSSQLVAANPNFWSVLIFYTDLKAEKSSKSSGKLAVSPDIELSADEEELYNMLKEWRNVKSQEIGIAPYMICSNRTLLTIIKVRPSTKAEFMDIHGFAEQKADLYAEDIIAVINAL